MELAARAAVPAGPHTAPHEAAVLGSPVTPESEIILAAARAAASAARWASAFAWYSVPMSMESAAMAIIATMAAATSASVTPRSFEFALRLPLSARRISGESIGLSVLVHRPSQHRDAASGTRAGGGVGPLKPGGARGTCARQSAVVNVFGYQIVVDHLEGVADGNRNRRGIINEIGGRI